MAFCIITDSASDVPDSVIKEYNLFVMPTPVTIDGEDLRDRVSIFPDEFYKIQKEAVKEIKTYHISQLMFEDYFTQFAERGDEVRLRLHRVPLRHMRGKLFVEPDGMDVRSDCEPMRTWRVGIEPKRTERRLPVAVRSARGGRQHRSTRRGQRVKELASFDLPYHLARPFTETSP